MANARPPPPEEGGEEAAGADRAGGTALCEPEGGGELHHRLFALPMPLKESAREHRRKDLHTAGGCTCMIGAGASFLHVFVRRVGA